MNKKILLGLTIFALLFVSCQKKPSKEVAVMKYVTHPALDEMEKAYVDKLNTLILSNKMDWKIKIYNANGNSTTANTIAKSFENRNVGLIFTIATPAAIAVSKITKDIPHVYGAVADPKGANIIPSNHTTGIANSGKNIIIEAILLIKAIYGKNVKIGTIYNPQEQNSIYVQELIKDICKEQNITLKQSTVQSSSNLNSVANKLCKEVDVIYSANDNTVNSGVNAITFVTNEYKIPFIIGDLSTLKNGALFAIGLEYRSMGVKLALMSFELMKDPTKIKSLPPEDAPKPEIWFNMQEAKVINYNLPDSLRSKYNIKIK
jgi:putative ABC transport system substrate-binding protein